MHQAPLPHVRLFLHTILLALLLSFSTSVGFAADQKVLFLGNSYTFGNQPNSLQDVAGRLMEEGMQVWDTVFTQQISHGGYRWEQHSKDAQGKGSDPSLHDLLVKSQQPEHQWNAVVLQEQSQIPGFLNTEIWNRSLQALQVMNPLIAARGAKTVLLMTWGYHKGDVRNGRIFGSYKAMQARLSQGYREFAKRVSSATRTVFVAPVGRAFEKIYDDLKSRGVEPTKEGTLFSRLYESDGSHPSLYGSYLAGAVVYATLTGRSPMGLTFNPGNKFSAVDLKTLQQAATWAVFRRDAGTYPYPWQRTWSQWKQPTDLVEPNQGSVVSSVGLRPLVLINQGSVKIAELTLGASHSWKGKTAKGAGRLLLSGIAELNVTGSLRVGAGGAGWLLLNNGFATVKRLLLGRDSGDKGTLELLGGTLRVDTLEKGDGDAAVVMRGGTLSAGKVAMPFTQAGGSLRPREGSLTIQGDYTQLPAATLTLAAPPASPSAPLVTVTGKADLRGTLSLTGDWSAVRGTVILLKAKEWAFGAGFKIEGVDEANVRKETDKEGNRIYTFQIVIPGREKSKEEPVADGGVSDQDAGNADVTPQENDLNTEGMISDSKEDDGCCQITDTPPAMLWFGAMVFLLLWGGRRKTSRRQ